MTQADEALVMLSCARCGRFSGAEVFCARCDERSPEREEKTMTDEEQLPNQAAAERLGLPRIVWEAMPYRVVEYYDDEGDRIHLALERWDGTDRLGRDRWQVVLAPNRYDAEGAHAGHWADAFWALATPLFVPEQEAQRRHAVDEARRERYERDHEGW